LLTTAGDTRSARAAATKLSASGSLQNVRIVASQSIGVRRLAGLHA
jgi:hypothetical protein